MHIETPNRTRRIPGALTTASEAARAQHFAWRRQRQNWQRLDPFTRTRIESEFRATGRFLAYAS